MESRELDASDSEATEVEGRSIRQLLRRFGISTLLCSISSIPSFWWAHGYDPAAKVVGVLIFIVLLTAVGCTQWFESFKRRPGILTVLIIGYGTGIFISLFFRIGILVDLYPGILMVGIADAMGITGSSFAPTLVITLMQGVALNIIVGVYMQIIYLIICDWI